MKINLLKISVLLLILSCISCTSNRPWATETVSSFEKIMMNKDGAGATFEIIFKKGTAHHYPLMVFWVEDCQGNFLQTLYVAQSVGKGYYTRAYVENDQWISGPAIRRATLPYWAHRQNSVLQRPDPYPSTEHPVPDAYTGATPHNNFILQSKMDKHYSGSVRVFMEINQFFDFNEHWTNTRFVEDADYKTSGQPSLIYVSDCIEMNKLPAEISLRMIGHGHYSGKDGALYTDLSTITTAKDIVHQVIVRLFYP